MFETKLSEESAKALRGLLGETVYRIYSPALEVEGKYIRSESFALYVENKSWLNIGTNEIEIDENHFGTWQLSASASETPKDLGLKTERVVVENSEIEIKVFERSPSIIFLALPSSAIEKISIYEDIRPFPKTDDSVLYEEVIIFHRKNSKTFASLLNVMET